MKTTPKKPSPAPSGDALRIGRPSGRPKGRSARIGATISLEGTLEDAVGGVEDDPAGALTGALPPAELAGWRCAQPTLLATEVARALRASQLALDTETTGLDAWAARNGMFGLSFAWREGATIHARYVPLRHKHDPGNLPLTRQSRAALRALAFDPGPLRVGHNFRYDANWFQNDDLWSAPPAPPHEDTLVLAWLENEERGPGAYALKTLSKAFVEQGADNLATQLAALRTARKIDDWAVLSVREIGPYAAQDARLTLLLWEGLDKALRDQDELATLSGQGHASLADVRTLTREFTPFLWKMEAVGVAVDEEYCHAAVKKIAAGQATATADMARILAEAGYGRAITPSRNADVAAALAHLGYRPRNPSDYDTRGAPRTNRMAVNRSGFGDHPFWLALQRWRAYGKAEKSYFGPLARRLAPDPLGTGAQVIHAEISQARARSGRLQAKNPNLMNIPVYHIGMSRNQMQINMLRGKLDEFEDYDENESAADVATLLAADRLDVREALVARPGYSLIFADFRQQELRAFADVSDEQRLFTAYREGKDVHALTASAVTAPPTPPPRGAPPEAQESYEKLVDQFRGVGKLLNFGMIFGMGSDKYYEAAAYGLAVDLEIDRFHEHYSKLSPDKKHEFLGNYSSIDTATEAFRAKRFEHYMTRSEKEVEAYHGLYPGVRKFHRALTRLGRRRGYVANKYGRRRRIPVGGRISQYFNFVIQGSCADLLRESVVQLSRALDAAKLKHHPLITIHDELIWEVWTPDVDRALAVFVRALTHPTGWRIDFPIELCVSTTTWAHKKERKVPVDVQKENAR